MRPGRVSGCQQRQVATEANDSGGYGMSRATKERQRITLCSRGDGFLCARGREIKGCRSTRSLSIILLMIKG